MEDKILLCEDSMEGIFSAVYDAYVLKCDPAHTSLQIGEIDNYRLFAEYIQVLPDGQKAEKVARSLQKRFGETVYKDISYALASSREEKATAVYRTVAAGLAMKNGRAVMQNLTDPSIRLVAQLKKRVWNEAHHLAGFLRFRELENGILFSKISPENNVLAFLADHFADRLPLVHFVIYDEKRRTFLIHPAGKAWFCVPGEALNEDAIEHCSGREREYQALFRNFCRKISIKERENEALQRQLLPLHFRAYMTEFGN